MSQYDFEEKNEQDDIFRYLLIMLILLPVT